MEAMNVLLERICNVLTDITRTETMSIECGANILAKAIQEDRRVHLLGTGAHSQIAVEDMLWRAGGLAAWNPILDPATNLLHGAKRSIAFERCPGYGSAVLDANRVGETAGEVMIIINAYGIDPMSLDIALECKKRGVYTIGVTSPSYGQNTSLDSPLRHPGKQNLNDVVDLFINSHVPYGDTVVECEGFDQKVASYSTFCSCFVMNAILACTVQELIKLGVKPPVFMSANLPEGDAANARWEEKYGSRARYLL